MRCRGGDSPARRCIGAINRLSLKWHWPQNCHCEGALRPWQSREGSCVFAGSILLFNRVLRDSHVASLLGMTNLGTSRHKIHTSNIASLQGGHSPQGHAASVRRQSRQRLRSERRYRRNRCAPFYRQPVRGGSVPPGAACRSPTLAGSALCQPVRLSSTAPRGVDFPNSAYPTKPTHQRSSIYHADRFFEDRRSSCSQF